MHRLLLAVDRLTLHDDRTQQNSQRLGVSHRTASIARRSVLLEQRFESDALEK